MDDKDLKEIEFKRKEIHAFAGDTVKSLKEMGMKGIQGFVDNKKNKRTIEKKANIQTHTAANVNWGVVANKLTIPKLAKGGLTLGGASAGSVIGAGLATGIGFAIGSAPGAVIGYKIGTVVGLGLGAVGGNKFGGLVENQLGNELPTSVVEKGVTEITADTEKNITLK